MTQRRKRPRTEVEAIIDRAVDTGRELLTNADDVTDDHSYDGWVHALERWHALTREALRACYESDEPAEEFYGAATGAIVRVWGGQSEAETFQYRREGISRGINTLYSLRERLDFADAPGLPTPADPSSSPADVGSGVFLVHGHDETTKLKVARFIEKVTSPGVTVLEEQPDTGRTVIEKFEQYASQMGFAVVLLTGDDEGRRRGSSEELLPRARQNVILELGFFIGKLGRGRVALLYEGGVELPSDISGVLYLPLDAGDAWKTKLAREMREARVPIDADALLGA